MAWRSNGKEIGRAAIPAYDRALRENPQLTDVHFHRGESLHHLRRYDEALAEYAIAVCPGSRFELGPDQLGADPYVAGQLRTRIGDAPVSVTPSNYSAA